MINKEQVIKEIAERISTSTSAGITESQLNLEWTELKKNGTTTASTMAWKVSVAYEAAPYLSNKIQTMAKPNGPIKHRYPHTYKMKMTTLRMNNVNEAKELENQIAEQNKSMSSRTYCVATVSSSELDFEAKETHE